MALGLAGCSFSKDNTEPPAELISFEPSLGVEMVWIRDSGAGTDELFRRLEPFVDGDAVFVADADGNVSAWDIETGKRRWRVDLDQTLTAGVNGGDGILVVGARSGEAIALRQGTGEEIWRERLSSEVMAVSEIEFDTVVLRTNDGKLHAAAAESGQVLWQVGRKTPALSLRGASRPLVTRGVVIAGFDNGKVMTVRLDDGDPLWEVTVAVPSGRSELERMVDIDGQLDTFGDTLYAVSFQGRVSAVSLREGRVLWTRDASSYSGLVVDREHLFLTDEWGAVWCLDRQTGATLWKQDALRLRQVTTPAIVGDHVVVGDLEGYVHWISREDGSFAARTRVDSEAILAAPLVRDDRVLVLGSGGELASLRPAALDEDEDAARGPDRPDRLAGY
jgi:outer membrane protein assembly factor BamB